MSYSLYFSALSKELQLLIVESCDMPTLFELCLTNRTLYDMAWPSLWRTIDFVNTEYDSDVKALQYRFFATCKTLLEDHRDRWEVLAGYVQTLRLSRLAGPHISLKTPQDLGDCNDSVYYNSHGNTDIFQVISHFTQLQTLTLFLKNNWSGTSHQILNGSLPRLRTLGIGGQIGLQYVEALLSRPEVIEDLSLVNLVEECGQDEGPDPLLFLTPLATRFTQLKYLHLSMLGDINLRQEYDELPERDSLAGWSSLLRNVSSTLVSLTLEMCYTRFRIAGTDDEVPEQWVKSEELCKNMLLPVLLEEEWLRLEQLTLVGLDALRPLTELPDRVKVEYLERRMVGYDYDVTPLMVSPPSDVFEQDWLANRRDEDSDQSDETLEESKS